MANSSINLVGLDFDVIKNDFKSYLQSQDQFRDYDFDGSNISVLLDILAYNTYKNAFYLNMAISEAFLDSSQLEASVLSHAKELNYLPRSNRSSKCKVRVNFQASGDTQPYIIEKGSSFTGIIKNESFVFTIPETLTASSTNTSFSYETFLFEGIYLKDSFIVNSNIPEQRFIITNKNVDTNSLTVTIYEDGSDVGENYTSSTTLLDLNSLSKVYFLQASDLGNYEVIFGDGILGKKPKNNSRIILDYRISNGERADGVKELSINFDPTNGDILETPEITVLENAIGGMKKESLDSIKYYAPRHFQVQERAITTSDYEIILKTQFPEINTLAVYGGEEVDPPRYGKVFIAIDVSNIDGIPENKKDEYYSFIKARSPLSIDPIIIEPIFTYLSINSKVRFNINISKSTPDRLKSLVTQSILDYNELYLDDFNSTLRNSKLNSIIDSTDSSIVSNITEILIYKKIVPLLGTSQNIDISLNVALTDDLPELSDNHPLLDRHTISSSAFKYNNIDVTLEDNGNGIIRIVQTIGDLHKKLRDVGTVNYKTGFIQLTNFNVDSYQGNALKIYAKPKDNDIGVSKNTILTIEPSEITIDIEAVRV
jgi:hypothetical protein